jgi:hypothetical protein
MLDNLPSTLLRVRIKRVKRACTNFVKHDLKGMLKYRGSNLGLQAVTEITMEMSETSSQRPRPSVTGHDRQSLETESVAKHDWI